MRIDTINIIDTIATINVAINRVTETERTADEKQEITIETDIKNSNRIRTALLKLKNKTSKD